MSSGHPVRFGTADLLQDLDRPNSWLVTVDGVPQSYVDLDDAAHLEFPYMQAIADVVDVAFPTDDPLRVLHLGGAACALPRWIAVTRFGSTQVVVEADGPLVTLLERELGVPGLPGIDVVVADARAAVEAMPAGSYDVVVVDVFSGAVVPSHVTTAEFVAELRRVLDVGGLLVANVGDGPKAPFGRRLAATLLPTFESVALVVDPGLLRGRRSGNVILAATADGRLAVDDLARRRAGRTPRTTVVSGEALAELVGDAAPLTDADAAPSPMPPNGWRLGGN